MSDFKAVEEVVEHYFKSAYNQDDKAVLETFHPSARIVGKIGDKEFDISAEDFAKRVQTQEKNYPYNKIIKAISVHQSIACVECFVQVGGLFFTEYLTLQKSNCAWTIRHKAFFCDNPA
jgi:hypothetical protein